MQTRGNFDIKSPSICSWQGQKIIQKSESIREKIPKERITSLAPEEDRDQCIEKSEFVWSFTSLPSNSLSTAWNTKSKCPGIWSFHQWLHLFIFFQWYHAQMRRVFKHHLGHQVTSYGPGLELTRLLPNESAKLTVVVLWPIVFQQPGFRKFNCTPCDLGTSSLDACSSEKP